MNATVDAVTLHVAGRPDSGVLDPKVGEQTCHSRLVSYQSARLNPDDIL